MSVSAIWTALYWAWMATEITILILTRTPRSTGAVRDRGSMLVLWLVIAISITAGSWIGATHRPTMFSGASWVRTVSIVIFATGLVIRWTAIATLGKYFSVNVAIHATQTVHKSGLFRYVRHPSYSGLLLIFVAIGIHTYSWIGFAIIVIATAAALLYRIWVEESALLDAFGDEYAEYSLTAKRLIPGIY